MDRFLTSLLPWLRSHGSGNVVAGHNIHDDSDRYGFVNLFWLTFKDSVVEREYNEIRGTHIKGSYAIIQIALFVLGVLTVVQATSLRFWPGVVNYSLVTIFAMSTMYLFYVKKSAFFPQYARIAFCICFLLMFSDTCEYIVMRKDNIQYDSVLSSAGIIYAYCALGLPWAGCLAMAVAGSVAVVIGTRLGHTEHGNGLFIYIIFVTATLLSYSGEWCWRMMFVALKRAENIKLGDQRMKYVANTSHDLRTPLNAFKLGLDLLSEDGLSHAEHSNVTGVLQEATGIMCNTIDNLLLFARSATRGPLEAIRTELIIPENLFNACRGICMSYGSGLGNNNGNVDIELNISPEVPRLILTDPSKLQQMTINLLTNARKFTKSFIALRVVVFHPGEEAEAGRSNPSQAGTSAESRASFMDACWRSSNSTDDMGSSRTGSVSPISSSLRQPVAGEGPMLRVEVWDDGPGIEPSQKSRLFRAFEQLDEDVGQGTGLGLFSIKVHSEAMGGSYGMRDNLSPGGGSIFFFQVPLVEPDSVASPRDNRSTAGSSEGGSSQQQEVNVSLPKQQSNSFRGSSHHSPSSSMAFPAETVALFSKLVSPRRLSSPAPDPLPNNGFGTNARSSSLPLGLVSEPSFGLDQDLDLENPADVAPHASMASSVANEVSLEVRFRPEVDLLTQLFPSNSGGSREEDDSRKLPGKGASADRERLHGSGTFQEASQSKSRVVDLGLEPHVEVRLPPAGRMRGGTPLLTGPPKNVPSSTNVELAATVGNPSVVRGQLERRHTTGSGQISELLGAYVANASEDPPGKSEAELLPVLVADDVALTQVLMKKMLNKAGFEVEIAGNGLEALEKMKAKKYTLVLMDLMMPIMDGFEAVRLYREWERISRPNFRQQICALTANAPNLESSEERTQKVGMDHYMSKPFRKEVLLDYLNKCIGKKERG